MLTRTKIICTIGPSVSSLDKMLQLIDAGMNVARLNFSHGTHEQHLKVIQDLKKAREIRKSPLAIMLDTKGPEIRVGKIKDGQIQVKEKDHLLLVKEEVEGDKNKISILPGLTLDALEEGMRVLFDDGYIGSKVVKKSKEGVVVEIENPGVIKSSKGVNVPGTIVDLPAMTEQDIRDITFGCEHDVDLIAASFIRSADHVLEIKKLLTKQKKSEILVIAKIENSEGVNNFDSIVQVADGIMVARGDLGVELPLKQVPVLQKMMIRKCCLARKPVVTATQMLESMIKNPRPTRAEVSDVANAIYDSTSAVMLSGETAVGDYAIETVKMMKSIVEEAEKDFDYKQFFIKDPLQEEKDISSAISFATVKTAYTAGAKAIFAVTSSGFTARMLSGFRPQMPILALSKDKKVYNQLALNWGVIPVDPKETKNIQESFEHIRDFTMKLALIENGDLVVITAGAPFGVAGSTNMMMIESIGDVLVRAHKGRGKKIHGKVAMMLTSDKDISAAMDAIVVITHCDNSYHEIFKHAIGIVLENLAKDTASEKKALAFAEEFDLPILIRTEHALELLRNGQVVTLDPQKAILYKGSMFGNKDPLDL